MGKTLVDLPPRANPAALISRGGGGGILRLDEQVRREDAFLPPGYARQLAGKDDNMKLPCTH